MDLQSTRENDASPLCCIPFHFGFSSSTSQRNSFCAGSLRLLSTTNSSFTGFFFFPLKGSICGHIPTLGASPFFKNPTKPPARPICQCDRQPSDLEGGASVKVCIFFAAGKQRRRSVIGLLLCTVSSTKGHLSLFFFFFKERKEQLVERVPPFPFRGHLRGGGGTHTVCRSDKQCASAPALHA